MALSSMRALSTKVDNGLSSGFESLAKVVTNRPITTIVATTLLAFALAPGMGIGGTEQNGENLWTPQDTVAKDHQSWAEATFGLRDRFATAYSVHNGENVLTQASLEALEKLLTGITKITAQCEEGSCKGKTVTYSDVKSKEISSVLSLWGDKAPAAGSDILAVVNDQSKYVSTGGQKLKVTELLGGIKYDANGNIISAEAFSSKFYLKVEEEQVGNTKADPETDAWEVEFDALVTEFTDGALAKNYAWTLKGQQEAGGSAISKDASMLGVGYMLLIVFSIIVLSHHKRVQSNGVMALASIASVGLSIVSAFGLGGYCGVKQNPVTTTLFLVLLGIGVDDSYVIMGDYRRATGDPQQRVVAALKTAGTSIAVTSLTDTVAFAAGASSSLPALRDFCIFAAIGIFFDFFYQVTWFIAVLTFRAKCTNDNRPDWLCCTKVDPESTGCFSCGAPVCSRNGKCVCCPCSKETAEGETTSMARSALKNITNLTLTPVGSVTVLVVTLGVLVGAATGVPNLKTDFNIEWFTPDDDPYKDTYEVRDKYFSQSGNGLPVYLYTKEGTYAAAHADGSLAGLYQRFENCDVIERSIGNWYSEFVKDATRSTNSKASELAFATEVAAFVDTPMGQRFKGDLAFVKSSNGAVSGIKGARSMYIAMETKSGEDDIRLTEKSRECAGGSPLDAFPYYVYYLYFDGLAVVDKETIQNVIVACVCVFVVNLIMLADILAATLVLAMLGLVDVCILGYMAHWDLNFNSVTAINLVLAVGLAVDYSAHIAHSFLVIRGVESGVERAKRAVDHIGVSVLCGAFSTFLAVLPLGLSKSYVFRVFFKMWFMIIIFGVWFGVIVLPVLLSLVGRFVGNPDSSQDSSQPAENEKEKYATGAETVGNKDAIYISNDVPAPPQT